MLTRAKAVWGGAWRHVGYAWCKLWGGHHDMAELGPGSWRLRCMNCGHVTPGWELSKSRVKRTT